jgi:hypothetical protein
MKASNDSWMMRPILSSTLGMLEGSVGRARTGTWSSAKPSPSPSLSAPRLSEGGAAGLPLEEPGSRPARGVLDPGPSEVMNPASLEAAVGVAIVEGSVSHSLCCETVWC